MYNESSRDLGLSISLESNLLYPLYYRRFGIRRAVQLVAPTLHPAEELDLPRGSILHFVSDDESLYGIPADDYIVRNAQRIIMVEHVTELGDNKGTPRSTRLPPGQMWRDYHRKYRKTRLLTNRDIAFRDDRTLMVENYALLPHLFRYTTSYFRSYYKWWNIQATVWKRVAELSQVSDRQQYLQCRLPSVLPTLSQLRKGEAHVTRTTLAAFTEPESLFILELWKWLGPNRETSVLAQAPASQLKNMNLIWSESGQWFVLNLGLLDDWRKPTKEELEAGAEEHGVVDAIQLQKRVLRLLMFLSEVRTVTSDAVPETPDDRKQSANGTVDAPVASIKKTEIALTTDVDVPTSVVEIDSKPVALKIEPVVITVPATQDSAVQKVKIKPGLDVDKLPEAPVEETHENIQAIDEAITKDLEALDHLMAELAETPPPADEHAVERKEPVAPSVVKYEVKQRSLEEGIMSKADALADAGLLSGAEYRRFTAIASAYKKLPDPYGSDKPLGEQIVISPEALKLDNKPQIADTPTVVDKSMLKSRLLDFDKRYIDEVMPKDITRSVVALQHAGVAITGYQIEQIEDALNAYESHTVQLSPVQGKASSVHFRIPKVDADGTYKANGVRYRLRKQRGDLPIRKLSSNRVALTSYYSKTFVTRSEKQAYNYANWLTNQIASIGMDPENNTITHLMMSNVFDSSVHTPRLYSVLATRFRSFNAGTYEFFFDYAAREKQFGADVVKSVEKEGAVIIGRQSGKYPVIVDTSDMLYVVKGDDLELIGSIENLLNLSGKAPIEMAELTVFKKQIPVGVFLAYHLGLSQLMALLDVAPRRVPAGERVYLGDDEYALRFEDETLVFARENRLVSQILSGLSVFDQSTRNYPVHLFDRKDIYFNILEQAGVGVRYLREMDLMSELFVDPITEEILKSLGEPTDFVGLLIRSCELLMTDWSPDETDMAYMRIKGYERIAGAIYGELVRAIRLQRARGSIANAKIELPPYAVWQAIQNDPAVKLVEEKNPIHNLKEKEEVTYSGTGGRSSRSMVKRTRVFHDNDMGVISEATKDSADVAITTFMTADPNLKDLRGLTERYNPKETGAASLLSTSALLAPAADRDDPKRVNFISIQQSAGTFAKGYAPTPVRTGYEQIIAQRTDDLYAYTAKQDGEITQLTPKAITVTYKDGTTKAVELGRRFGTAAGMTLPHEVVTTLQVGAKVKAGDAIAYNSHYFAVDPLDPKRVVWKAGVLVRTAIMESVDTLEDSSAISERTAQLLETKMTKIRDIVVSFDQSIHNLVQPGTEVDNESILCTIEDAVSAQTSLFDTDSLDTLRLIAANTPRAKFKGVVEKIEVFYNGDIDDLSPSLQELAQLSDRNRKRHARELKTRATTGRVDDSMRIEGTPLTPENAVIRVYITGPVPAGVGDKGVFANQMKTIFGRVLSGVNETESGDPIDAIFGYSSINDRIVLSPEIIGTTNTLLRVISRKVAGVYFGDSKK